MTIVQAPLAAVDPHRDLHRRARALRVPGGRADLDGTGGGAHRGRGCAARRCGLCAGRGFSLAGAGRAVLGVGVRAAVLAHRPGAVARAAGWVVGVPGVGLCGCWVSEFIS